MSRIHTKTVFFLLIAVWYTLTIPQYNIYRILPIVQMGERSWPLYFFLLNGLVLFTTGLFFFLIISNCWRGGRFHVRSLLWLFAGLLLIFPLFTVKVTYSYLTGKLCKEHKDVKCIRYVPPPDFKNIRFTWEKKSISLYK